MDCNWILIWFKVQVVAKPWVLILLEPADGPTKPPSHPIQTCSSAVQRPEFRVWYLLINSRMNQCLQPSGSLYHSDLCTWVQACVWIRRRLSHCSFSLSTVQTAAAGSQTGRALLKAVSPMCLVLTWFKLLKSITVPVHTWWMLNFHESFI